MKKNFHLLFKVWKNNLTARYVIGLSLVAVLTILSQILIQIEATKQDEDQGAIQRLSNLYSLTKNLRKDLVSYQLQGKAKAADIDIFDDLVMRDMTLINRAHEQHMKLLELSYPKDAARLNLITQLVETHRGLSDTLDHFRAEIVKGNLEKVDSLIQESLKHQELHSKTLVYYQKIIEEKSAKSLANLRRLEFFFMGLTLFILFLEALFIFRPAVDRLNRALDVRSKFINRVSHEIKNPLNAILGMSTLLEDTLSSPNQKRLIGRIQRAGGALLGVLENILEYSSFSEGKYKINVQEIPILQVIEKSVELASPEFDEKRLNFHVYVDPLFPVTIRTDFTKMQQIIYNLLNNATKFTQNGFVSLGIHLLKSSSSNFMQIVVADTGPGIATDKQGLIFEAFTQADDSIKRRHGGAGLGLAIVKDLCDLLEGSIKIDPEYKKGARFLVTLPLLVTTNQTLQNYYLMEKSKNLLIYSKDKLYLKSLKEMTELFSITPICYSSVSELSKAHAFQEERFLIDVSLNSSSDLEDLQFFRKRLGNKSALYLVFENDFSKLLKSLQISGEDEIALKPLLPSQLGHFLIYGQLQRTQLTPSATIELTADFKMVIIDDDQNNLDIISGFLGGSGQNLKIFNDASEALEWLKTSPSNLIITDMEMPGKSGYEIAEALRSFEMERSLPRQSIYAFSAYRLRELAEDPRWRHFDGFIEKPIDRENLFSVLLTLIGNQSSRSRKSLGKVVPVLQDLVPQYIQRKLETLQGLLKFQSLDLDEVKRFGHQLRGTAPSYGLKELGDLGTNLENQAQSGNTRESTEILLQMNSLLLQYSETIKTADTNS